MAKFIEIKPDHSEIPEIKAISKEFVPKRVPKKPSNNYLYQADPVSYQLFEKQTGKLRKCYEFYTPRVRSSMKKSFINFADLINTPDQTSNCHSAKPRYSQKLAKLDKKPKTANQQNDQIRKKSTNQYIIEPEELLKDVQVTPYKPVSVRAARLNPSFVTKYKSISHKKTKSLTSHHSRYHSSQDVNSILHSQAPRIFYDDRQRSEERPVYHLIPAHGLIKKKPKYISLEKLIPASNFASTCLLPLKKKPPHERVPEKSLKIKRINPVVTYEETFKSFDSFISGKLDAAVSANTLATVVSSVSRIEGIITAPRDTVLVSDLHI